ncbi:hypothetical protein ACNFG0_09845 [Pseudomonas sp. NY15372]|uniref:hypothetical protein n=1 Tax=Pseudomonas sp. NY15372 TaxID=3400356 RepID=UPI003A86C9BD
MTTPTEALQARQVELTAARRRARQLANPVDQMLYPLAAEFRVRIAEARVRGLDDVAQKLSAGLCIWMKGCMAYRHGLRV